MEERSLGIKWVPQISIGNGLSIITIITVVSVQWGLNASRIANAENRLDKVEQKQESLDESVHSIDKQLGIIGEKQQQQIKQLENSNKVLEQISNQLQMIQRNQLHNQERNRDKDMEKIQ